MKIYVVMGFAGEYSDKTEWPVAAFTQEDAAVRRENAATDEANRIWKEYRIVRSNAMDYDEAVGWINKQQMVNDKWGIAYLRTYEHVDYYHIEVELEEEKQK